MTAVDKENNTCVEITLYDGKYTYIREEGRGQHVLRYGERWRDLTGDGFVLAMAQEIEELREKLAVHGPATLDASPDTPTENERTAENGEQPEAIISAWGDSFSGPQKSLLAAMAGGEPVPPASEQVLLDGDLLATTDAAIWAREFCRIASNLGHEGIDEGWMVTWFACAMAAQEIKTARETASKGEQ